MKKAWIIKITNEHTTQWFDGFGEWTELRGCAYEFARKQDAELIAKIKDMKDWNIEVLPA